MRNLTKLISVVLLEVEMELPCTRAVIQSQARRKTTIRANQVFST
uniref:Uncharacterized protein n=1 Tax=Ciona savignyi TaxID=51511 RepID=H2YIV3_CIOSA